MSGGRRQHTGPYDGPPVGPRDGTLLRARRRFVVLTALRWFPTGVVVPVMVLLMRERGLDLATVGLLGALYSIVTVALELPTGGLADVVGRRPVLAASSAMTLVALLLLASGTTALALGVAYAVFGAARALDSGPLQAWYVDAVHAVDPHADLKPGLSRASAAEALGLGVGALAGGGIVAVSPLPTHGAALIALSTPFLLAAVFGVVHLVVLLLWVTDPPRERRPSLRDVVADVPRTVAHGAAIAVRRPVLRRIVAFTVAFGVALASVELLAPNSFAAMLGGESAAAAPYAVLVTLGFFGSAAGAALAPGVARLARGSSRGILLTAVLSAGALAAVGVPVLGVAAAAFVAFYLFLGMGGPLLDELTHEAVASRERATILSVNSMALQLGGVGASLGIGALAGSTSVAVGLAAAAAVLVLGSLAMVGLRVSGPAQAPPPAAGEPCSSSSRTSRGPQTSR
ncbi:MFS transporter [Cellulomonas sp. PhB143]|uniref:MFS transporter n=1 Tax=Cellulomonas sp. PhB143 TaxID=2485186 RepID=UPI000F469EA4|nr:MFS transporter [Cellulomonas sp. PhB143]ROS79115.1 putative MFS family arabinose efflux permease [Cellulomonas sp. PhB143]